ncbi:MAG TPA: sigma-70 family RNA polymerase sigma factor [Pirellulaceae bacterium]|nr:sigma-70 family RNA polymerase sigma factor [Pirellulaceae bacterium]
MIAAASARRAPARKSDIEFIPNAKFASFSPDEWSSTTGDDILSLLTKRVMQRPRGKSGGNSPLAQACEMPLLSAAEERTLFERMNYLKYRAHQLHEWLDPTEPSEEQQREITDLLQQAEQVRNRIVGANVRLVVSIAKTFADTKNPFDELVSDGILSMMQAVEKFDYDRGFRFSTYATRAIRRNLYRLLLARQKERTRFSPTAPDVMCGAADERPISAISEGRWTLLQGQLARMLRKLDARERLIIRARFGMTAAGTVQTLQALAKTLGVCKERVRQIERRAIEKLEAMAQELHRHDPAASFE